MGAVGDGKLGLGWGGPLHAAMTSPRTRWTGTQSLRIVIMLLLYISSYQKHYWSCPPQAPKWGSEVER